MKAASCAWSRRRRFRRLSHRRDEIGAPAAPGRPPAGPAVAVPAWASAAGDDGLVAGIAAGELALGRARGDAVVGEGDGDAFLHEDVDGGFNA